jgi:hypothetical protein
VRPRKPYPLYHFSAAQPAGTSDTVESAAVRPIQAAGGWPTRRMPMVGWLAIAVLIVGTVLVALVHRPSTAERAADLRAFVSDMQADIGSCAADVGASLAALSAVERRTSTDVGTARTIATSGAADCSPANDEELGDLVQYQVTESLFSFRLGRVVDGLVAWAAPDAQAVQTDVAGVLSAATDQARQQALSALSRAIRVLDAQRASVDSIIDSASRALSAHASPPLLPG